jgi:hypothetical protein
MKTEVQMKRQLFGMEISQKSKSELFSATDLVKAGTKWRLANQLSEFNMSAYLDKKSTKEFINELSVKYGEVLIMGRGRNAQTWVHPLLFIDMALEISPKLKVEVYEWLFDNLIKYRNDSGDSYKEMAAALWQRSSNTREFPKVISNIALVVKEACNVKDWEHATEAQLIKRDKIHNSIKLLTRVLKNTDQILRIAIEEHTKL